MRPIKAIIVALRDLIDLQLPYTSDKVQTHGVSGLAISIMPQFPPPWFLGSLMAGMFAIMAASLISG
jgi:hypothetical protein